MMGSRYNIAYGLQSLVTENSYVQKLAKVREMPLTVQ